jgi:hypothetical protein
MLSYQKFNDSTRIEDELSSVCRDGRIRYATSILEGAGKSLGRPSHASRTNRRCERKVKQWHLKWFFASFKNVNVIHHYGDIRSLLGYLYSSHATATSEIIFSGTYWKPNRGIFSDAWHLIGHNSLVPVLLKRVSADTSQMYIHVYT